MAPFLLIYTEILKNVNTCFGNLPRSGLLEHVAGEGREKRNRVSTPLSSTMGPTLRVEPIRAGEELRRSAKPGPSMRLESDTPTHPGANPESVGELLTRPVSL